MSDPKQVELTEDDLAEQASLAALDFLTPSELVRLPRQTVDWYREAAVLVAMPLKPVTPPAGLRNRLMRRVADYQQIPPASEVRTFDGGWRATGLAGIDFKPLYHDKKTGMFTQMVRMAPGAQYPRHMHFDDEQCLVLKGDVHWGEAHYLEGDFVTTKAGIVHPTLETVQGNVLLIISGHNEFVPEHAN